MPHCQGAAQGSSHKRVIAGSDAPCSCVKWSSIPPGVSHLQATGHSMCSQCMVDTSFCFSNHCLCNPSPQHSFQGLPLSQQWSVHHHIVRRYEWGHLVLWRCGPQSHCLLVLSAQERWNPLPGPKGKAAGERAALVLPMPAMLQRSKRHHYALKNPSGLCLYVTNGSLRSFIVIIGPQAWEYCFKWGKCWQLKLNPSTCFYNLWLSSLFSCFLFSFSTGLPIVINTQFSLASLASSKPPRKAQG